MKMKTQTTIDNKTVRYIGSSDHIDFYESLFSINDSDNDEVVHLVDMSTSDVIASIEISCGMCQGRGFVESIIIKNALK